MTFEYRREDSPEINRTAYYIADTYGNQIELSPEQTLDLLNWLTQQRVELFCRRSHPESTGDFFDEPPPSW